MTSQINREYYDGCRHTCWNLIHEAGYEGKEIETFFDESFSGIFHVMLRNEIKFCCESFVIGFLEKVSEWEPEKILRNRYEQKA
jgi:hypothetical protein